MLRFPAEAGEVTGERVVESRKVTPNDVRVERAQDRFLRLAIEEEPHHGLDATRGLGAELLPALGFGGVDRDPVPAFAAQVMDDHVKSEPTTTTGGNSDRRLAHPLLSIAACPEPSHKSLKRIRTTSSWLLRRNPTEEAAAPPRL